MSQGGSNSVSVQTGSIISYPIAFHEIVGYLDAAPICVGETVFDIIPTLNVYSTENKETFGVWTQANGAHIPISVKWLAIGY